jgi:hypothetical protein
MRKNNIVEVFQHEKETAYMAHGQKLLDLLHKLHIKALADGHDISKIKMI